VSACTAYFASDAAIAGLSLERLSPRMTFQPVRAATSNSASTSPALIVPVNRRLAAVDPAGFHTWLSWDQPPIRSTPGVDAASLRLFRTLTNGAITVWRLVPSQTLIMLHSMLRPR
jgi:hypothetical protein